MSLLCIEYASQSKDQSRQFQAQQMESTPEVVVELFESTGLFHWCHKRMFETSILVGKTLSAYLLDGLVQLCLVVQLLKLQMQLLE